MTQDTTILFKNHHGKERNLLEIDQNELLELYDCHHERESFWLPTGMPSRNKNQIDPYPVDSREIGQRWKNQYYTFYLSNSRNDIEDHNRDLFLFCIFSDRSKEAKQLCYQFDKPYIAYLIAAKIYRRAARVVRCQNYKRSHYLSEAAEEYSKLAAQSIDRVHRYNCTNRQPVELLLKRDQTFFNYTAWELINRSDCRSIHESDLIRKYVRTIWYNDMDDCRICIHFRIFLATIFVPLIPLLLLIPGFIPFRKEIGWFKKIKMFYTAPIVQFYYYYIIFIGFLIIHGYAIMMAYFPLNVYGEIRAKTLNFPLTRSEMITHVWIFTLIVEEVLEFIQIYLFALILRLPRSEGTFVTSKILMCLAFILWCTRLLRVFTIFKQLGWCLLLIFRMMKAFVFFFSFILINIFAFSIAVKALLITKEQVTWYYTSEGVLQNATVADGGNGDGYEMFDWIEIKKLFDWGIWKVFGDTQDGILDYEDAYTVVAWIWKIIFVCATNIVLISTLIVLLNIIGDNTKQRSKILQRYEHFLIIMEFCEKDKLPLALRRSLVPPPLNIIWYIIRLIFPFITSKSNQQTDQTETVFTSLKEDPYLLVTYTRILGKKEEEEVIMMHQPVSNTHDIPRAAVSNSDIRDGLPNDSPIAIVSDIARKLDHTIEQH